MTILDTFDLTPENQQLIQDNQVTFDLVEVTPETFQLSLTLANKETSVIGKIAIQDNQISEVFVEEKWRGYGAGTLLCTVMTDYLFTNTVYPVLVLADSTQLDSYNSRFDSNYADEFKQLYGLAKLYYNAGFRVTEEEQTIQLHREDFDKDYATQVVNSQLNKLIHYYTLNQLLGHSLAS